MWERELTLFLEDCSCEILLGNTLGWCIRVFARKTFLNALKNDCEHVGAQDGLGNYYGLVYV